MPRYLLFAYVDGAELEDVAESLEARFNQFVGTRRWLAGQPTVINQSFGKVQITESGVTELWRLGLTMELPESGAEFPKWFVDVEAIARFLGVLHSEFGMSFSLGFVDCETDRHEELFDISKLPVINGVRYVV